MHLRTDRIQIEFSHTSWAGGFFHVQKKSENYVVCTIACSHFINGPGVIVKILSFISIFQILDFKWNFVRFQLAHLEIDEIAIKQKKLKFVQMNFFIKHILYSFKLTDT